MKTKEIFTDSISFPFSNLKRFLSLGFILIFSPLILPTILAQGYIIRTIRNTAQGHREMPEFKNWVDMFIDGLKYLIVSVVYGLPGGVLLYIAIMISIFSTMSQAILTNGTMNQTAMYTGSTMNILNLVDGTIPLILAIAGLLLLTLSYIIQLIAIPRMVYKNRVGAAFEFKEIYREIQTLGWKKYLTCGIFIVILAFISMACSMFLPDLLKHYGMIAYAAFFIIFPLIFDAFFFAFQGRFMGLIYPGEVENEDETGKKS